MKPEHRRTLAALLRPLLVGIGVVIVLLEEVIWDLLGHLMARLARLPIISHAEDAIRKLPPYSAMVLFLLPILFILPFNIAAGWLMADGRFLTGLLVLLAAKFSGMAIWVRLYALCHPALLTVGWFAKLEVTLLRWRAWAHDRLDHIESLRRARELTHAAVAAVKGWAGETEA